MSIPNGHLSVKTVLTSHSDHVTVCCVIRERSVFCHVGIERPIDTKEVAEMLGVTPRTVTRLADKGEIPGFKVGDVWRFHRQDIVQYIEKQKRGRRPKSDE